jgi:type I restriction enzyme S subunit
MANKAVNQASINQTRLEGLSIPIPPLETQRKIVAILDKAEETKRLRAKSNELTQKFLQSVFLEMFGDPMQNPRNYGKSFLGDISEVVSGVTKGRKMAGPAFMVPYLRVANVQDGYLDLDEVKQIEATKDELAAFKLEYGDIVITEGGDPDKLGRGSVWRGQIPNCIHQNHIFRLRVNSNVVHHEYLSWLLGSNYGKRYFLKSSKQTTGIATINSKQLKGFPVILPPLELQQEFARIVEYFQQLNANVDHCDLEFERLQAALMSAAFKGEITS